MDKHILRKKEKENIVKNPVHTILEKVSLSIGNY